MTAVKIKRIINLVSAATAALDKAQQLLLEVFVIEFDKETEAELDKAERGPLPTSDNIPAWIGSHFRYK